MIRTEFIEAGRPVKTAAFEEPLRDLYGALEALLGTTAYNTVISGCVVAPITGGYNISSGIVLINGKLATVYSHDILTTDPCLYLSTTDKNVIGSEVTPLAVDQPDYYACKELTAEASQDTDTAAAYNTGRIRLYGYDTLDIYHVRKMADRFSALTANQVTLLFGTYVDTSSNYNKLKRFTVKHQLSGTGVATITTNIDNTGIWAGEIVGINVLSYKLSGGTVFISDVHSTYYFTLSFPTSPTDRVLTMYPQAGGFFTFDGEVTIEYLIKDTMTPY